MELTLCIDIGRNSTRLGGSCHLRDSCRRVPKSAPACRQQRCQFVSFRIQSDQTYKLRPARTSRILVRPISQPFDDTSQTQMAFCFRRSVFAPQQKLRSSFRVIRLLRDHRHAGECTAKWLLMLKDPSFSVILNQLTAVQSIARLLAAC